MPIRGTSRMIRPQDAAEGAEIAGLLADLEALAAGRESVPLGEVLAAIGTRGFGPVLVVLALLLILPVGMIPGMPDIVALATLAVAAALLRRRRLRLPRWLRSREIGTELLSGGITRLRPLARKIGQIVRPRLAFLIEGRLAELMIALVLVAIAVVILAIGLIPGLPFAFAIPLALIGIGLVARDGLAVLFAYLLLAIAPLVVLVLMP